MFYIPFLFVNDGRNSFDRRKHAISVSERAQTEAD